MEAKVSDPTPGPWEAVHKKPQQYGETLTGGCHYNDDYYAVVGADKTVICDNGQYYAAAIDPSNRHLIAAAPEMLEALKEAKLGLIVLGGEDGDFSPAYRAVVDAIAKAERRV